MRFLPDGDNGWRVEVTVADLKALIAHASKDTARPHVNAIFIDPSGRRAAATDGHRIAVVTDETAKVGADLVDPMLLAVSDAKKLVKLGAKTWTICNSGEATATTRDGSKLTANFTPVDAKFPPIDSVLAMAKPTPSPCPAVAFNAWFLADLALVVEAADCRIDALGVTLCMPAANDHPALFVAGPWTVVVMPMKTQHSERILREVAEAEAAADEPEAA